MIFQNLAKIFALNLILYIYLKFLIYIFLKTINSFHSLKYKEENKKKFSLISFIVPEKNVPLGKKTRFRGNAKKQSY